MVLEVQGNEKLKETTYENLVYGDKFILKQDFLLNKTPTLYYKANKKEAVDEWFSEIRFINKDTKVIRVRYINEESEIHIQ